MNTVHFFQGRRWRWLGDAANSQSACTAPTGFVEDGTDTDDSNAAVFPGCTETTYYADADGDGFGNPSVSQSSCLEVTGFVTDNTDTDDTNASIFPNCEATTYYADADGDGFGNSEVSQSSCVEVTGFVTDNTDTDDTNAEIFPGCTEITYYADTDGDGFGNPEVSQSSCVELDGFVADNTDFNDTDANLNPDAEEIADNDVDENGDGIFLYNLFEDGDGDGFGTGSTVAIESQQVVAVAEDAPDGYALVDGDCNDNNAAIYPGAPEVWGDGVANNCTIERPVAFTKEDLADHELEENQDRITDVVWLTRSDDGLVGFYNVFSQNQPMIEDMNCAYSADDIEWARGSTATPTNELQFGGFFNLVDGCVDNDFFLNIQNIIGEALVLHLISEDIYIDVVFTSYSIVNIGGSGGFSYMRSAPNN
ncbi:putative metal-binding motif-containing protein [Flagellimonas sp.]|uniref:putative metal-binding motif-containing protein n=1 Tax=Flagellimonas sp. TaxID=2058762 RepID=UPI003F4A130F